MKVKMHTFGINWERAGITSFLAASKEELEEKITKYLREDSDFESFLRALKNNDLEEEDRIFVSSLLKEQITPVITMEHIDRLNELDIDDLKYSEGRISSWGYEEEEIDLTKALAQRSVSAENSVTESSQKSEPFNEWQKVMMRAYGGGDYKGFSPETVHQVADGLFQFLVTELSESEDCVDMEEALKRVDRATQELHSVADALAHALITTQKPKSAGRGGPKKPSGPGM